MKLMRNSGETPAAAAVIRRADEGARLEILGAHYVFKATSAETAGSFCCIEVSVPPGCGVPSHTHAHEDEAFHVLAGEVVIDCAGLEEPQCLGLGAFFFGPRGLRHAFRNESAEEARLLVFCLPGAGIEAMFRQMNAAGRGPGIDGDDSRHRRERRSRDRIGTRARRDDLNGAGRASPEGR